MKKRIFIILFLILILTILYSRFIAPKGLIVKEYTLYEDIPASFNGLKIIHFSDLHYGRLINEQDLNNIKKKINLINPDLIVFTGDLVDRDYQKKDLTTLSKFLSSLHALYGKYAVLGNHDYDYNATLIKDTLTQSAFVVLQNESKPIYNKTDYLLITGIDDVIHHKSNNIISNDDHIYNITLVHEPDYTKEIINQNVHLILSGHSHNGQVRIPFIGAIYKVNGAKTYYDEHYQIGNKNLYISSGLGVSGLNFRFLNKPSINFYRINKK